MNKVISIPVRTKVSLFVTMVKLIHKKLGLLYRYHVCGKIVLEKWRLELA
jgi:hypothetical protein